MRIQNKAFLLTFLLSITHTLCDLPECTIDPSASSNRCGGVTCSSGDQCQSMQCNYFNKCSGCVNSDLATYEKCEGLKCSSGSECLLGACNNGYCDLYKTIEDGFKLVGWILVAVIVIPILCCVGIISLIVCCCIKSRNRRMQAQMNNYVVIQEQKHVQVVGQAQ